MPLDLFEDSDPDESKSKSKSEEFEINHDYARVFEHNKKREALHRLEELKKKGLASDSDDSSDDGDDEDNGIVVSSKTDLQFYDTLIKVKKKDPVISQKDVKLYDSDDKDGGDSPKGKKEKPLYLKDVVAKQLLEDGPEFGEEEGGSKTRESQAMVYSKEQEEYLKEFHEAAQGLSDDDELFEKKERGVEEEENEEENLEIKKKVNEYWGDDNVLDENDLFLKNFFAKKMWVDKDKGNGNKCRIVDDFADILDDDEALEKQEKYEAEFNFRYEEGVGDQILGHSRFTEGSMRKKTNARKIQRQNKEARMAQAEFERKEELKYLKNLKKKEIEEKLGQIRAIAGIGDGNDCKLDVKDLDEEFDPEEHDKKMKAMFDEDYYVAEDANPLFGSDVDDDLEKPDFNKEDELLGLPKNWDVVANEEGSKLAAEEGVGGIAKAEDLQYTSKRKREQKLSLKEKDELEKDLDEYYKLDYEDTIGDLKTRFKYKSVQPNRFGLSTTEILSTDDQQLNQYVSLKKIAPYVQEEWKVPRTKRYQMKVKKIGADGENTIKSDKINKKNRSKGSMTSQLENDDGHDVLMNETSADEHLSKKQKRKLRQAEIKVNQSRLVLYEKIPAMPKKQKKKKKQ